MSDQHDETKPTWTAPSPEAAPPATPPTAPLAAPPGVVPAAPAMNVPVTPVVATPPTRKKSGAWVNVLLGVAAIIAVGGVAFAIGRSTAPASAAGVGNFGNPNGGFVFNPGGSFDPNALPGGSFDPGAAPGGGRGLFGAGGITIDGTVQSVDGSSMVVKLASGQTVTVQLDADTQYHQSTPATASDLAAGDDVAVKVSGGFGGGFANGNGNANGNGTGANPQFTASDVTVSQ